MDQTADLLIRIKNAAMVKKNEVTMPYSKMKEAILSILKDNGYIGEVSVHEDKSKKFIKASLLSTKYPSHIRQISSPGHRIYIKAKDIKIPLRGFGLLILSTPSGIISAQEARKKGFGGEAICEIW